MHHQKFLRFWREDRKREKPRKGRFWICNLICIIINYSSMAGYVPFSLSYHQNLFFYLVFRWNIIGEIEEHCLRKLFCNCFYWGTTLLLPCFFCHFSFYFLSGVNMFHVKDCSFFVFLMRFISWVGSSLQCSLFYDCKRSGSSCEKYTFHTLWSNFYVGLLIIIWWGFS